MMRPQRPKPNEIYKDKRGMTYIVKAVEDSPDVGADGYLVTLASEQQLHTGEIPHPITDVVFEDLGLERISSRA
jgi:hypothetical protein